MRIRGGSISGLQIGSFFDEQFLLQLLSADRTKT